MGGVGCGAPGAGLSGGAGIFGTAKCARTWSVVIRSELPARVKLVFFASSA